MDYSYSDLNRGDTVIIRAGKYKGKIATIQAVTAHTYFMKLQSGRYCSVRHGSLLQRYTQRV